MSNFSLSKSVKVFATNCQGQTTYERLGKMTQSTANLTFVHTTVKLSVGGGCKMPESVVVVIERVAVPQLVGAPTMAGSVTVRPIGAYSYTIHITTEKQVKGLIDEALRDFILKLREVV
jgi:hypothetical protein